MTKAQALHHVASWVAGNIAGGTFEESTGLMQSQQERLSKADWQRLAWAIEEVTHRLHRMGTRGWEPPV